MKHTKGPWGSTRINDYYLIGGDGHAICRVESKDENNKADAQLISAAPDLLKELEENVEAIREFFKDEDRSIDCQEYSDLLDNILCDNLSIINKAKGKL